MNSVALEGAGILDLSFDEIDWVAGASEWGNNVLTFGGAGGVIGGFIGAMPGAAVGVLVGVVVGTVITVVN